MNQFVLRKLEEKDYLYLKELWRSFFSKDVAENRDTSFNWIWRDNPYKDEGDRYAVMEEDDKIIAYEGIMPYHFSIDGNDVDGYVYQDTMVDPSVRGKGIGTKLITAMLEKYPKFGIAVWMNGPNSHVFEKCGWETVSNLPTYVRIYNSIPFLTNKIGAAGKAAGMLLNVVLKIVYGIERLISAKNKNTACKIEIVEEFDERIDTLFEKVKGAYFCITFRTGALLNWRYAHSNSVDFKKLICVREDEVVGYLVYRIRADKSGRRIATIFDFLSIDDGGDVFSTMLRKAIGMIEQEKADQIEVLCTSKTHLPILKRNLFIRGWDNPIALKYVHTREIKNSEKLAHGSNWFFTYGDGDKLFWDI